MCRQAILKYLDEDSPEAYREALAEPQRIRLDDRLTMHGDHLLDQLSISYQGMAHFAGSGPSGARCRGCAHWGERHSAALSRPCRKFTALTGVKSKQVPGSARACRHFEKELKS